MMNKLMLYCNTNKIQPMNLFHLLIALEQTSVDAMRDDYSILE